MRRSAKRSATTQLGAAAYGDEQRGVDILNDLIKRAGGCRAFADRISIDRKTVYAYRTGYRWFSPATALRVEIEFGVPAEQLMFFDKLNGRPEPESAWG